MECLQGQTSEYARSLEHARGDALAAREKAQAAVNQLRVMEVTYLRELEALEMQLRAATVSTLQHSMLFPYTDVHESVLAIQ